MSEIKIEFEIKNDQPASKETIRKFVKDMADIGEKLTDARSALNEAIKSHEEIIKIDEELKALKEQRKSIIENSEVIKSYTAELEEVMDEKRQIISDAKRDNVPKDEIDTSIKMLKKNIDPIITTEVYKSIADLVDV